MTGRFFLTSVYIHNTSDVPEYIPRNETGVVGSKQKLTSISHARWFLDNSSTVCSLVTLSDFIIKRFHESNKVVHNIQNYQPALNSDYLVKKCSKINCYTGVYLLSVISRLNAANKNSDCL